MSELEKKDEELKKRQKLLPGGSVGKRVCLQCRRPGFGPGSGRSPGEGMATHSSILAWRIPWTEETGGLQSMGSQRIGQD